MNEWARGPSIVPNKYEGNKWTRPLSMTLNKNQVYDRMRDRKSNVRKRSPGVMVVALVP